MRARPSSQRTIVCCPGNQIAHPFMNKWLLYLMLFCIALAVLDGVPAAIEVEYPRERFAS